LVFLTMSKGKIMDFPYEIIQRFDTIREAENAGFLPDQTWSVVETDNCFTYGPPHHLVNLLYYVTTKETHDHNTYFDEEWEEQQCQN